ncbi:hypothetical protein FB451DRAFT_1413786 [Mycena latifolia]|nr:hypothetical protein FB451DRAFT_1413786 [Mycena latifolia]
MVIVSACTPYVMQHDPPASPSFASTTPDPPTPGHESAQAPRMSRRPPVLTMTPARASLYAEIRYSSPSGSRSSSRRRPELPDRYMYGAPGMGSGRGKQASTASASEWFGGSASESDVEVEDSAVPEVEGEVRISVSSFILPACLSDTHALVEQANGVLTPRAQPPPHLEGQAKVEVLGIAFSWSDTAFTCCTESTHQFQQTIYLPGPSLARSLRAPAFSSRTYVALVPALVPAPHPMSESIETALYSYS